MSRIVFFGTPSFAVPSLDAIIKAGEDVVAVVTQPDRPKGRGRILTPSPVKELAMQHKIPILQPERIRDGVFVKRLKELATDFIVVVAYGNILPKMILDIPPFGCVNLHASLLPRYRGAAPVNWAIINGERETGVTTMLMDEGMDTGPILLSERLLIANDDTAETLGNRLAKSGAGLLLKTLVGLRHATIKPIPQDHTQATYAPMLKKEGGHIDWCKGAEEIRNLVRGLIPWPGAYTSWKEMRWNIYGGEVVRSETKARPGTILRTSPEGIEVATGKGIFLITELQLEGKKRMKVSEFLRGYRVEAGQVLN
ncbi:MAG: methionyl-tRNA formyltransferase [Deltaproteobacteria bacterium]|nr:methionyl-tRNA formyltransferase [Deltaproteobacteria bacterium]